MPNLIDYRNVKKHVSDGFVFDSKKEVRRYSELKLMEAAGLLTDLVTHPSFVLQDKFKRGKTTYREIRYVADFGYRQGAAYIAEDVKGFETAVFKLKEKMFRFKFPGIDLRIIK